MKRAIHIEINHYHSVKFQIKTYSLRRFYHYGHHSYHLNEVTKFNTVNINDLSKCQKKRKYTDNLFSNSKEITSLFYMYYLKSNQLEDGCLSVGFCLFTQGPNKPTEPCKWQRVTSARHPFLIHLIFKFLYANLRNDFYHFLRKPFCLSLLMKLQKQPTTPKLETSHTTSSQLFPTTVPAMLTPAVKK